MNTIIASRNMPCLYCCDPVGPDGESDDGEFYICARCRAAALSRSEELKRTRSVASAWHERNLDVEPTFPFEVTITRADLDEYLTHVFGGRRMTPELLAERILERIRREASGELDYDREPAIPLEAAPLPASDCERIMAYLNLNAPRFQTFGAAAR